MNKVLFIEPCHVCGNNDLRYVLDSIGKNGERIIMIMCNVCKSTLLDGKPTIKESIEVWNSISRKKRGIS